MGLLHTTRTVDQLIPQCEFCKTLFGAGPFTANGVPIDAPDLAAALERAGWLKWGDVVACRTCVAKGTSCPRCRSTLTPAPGATRESERAALIALVGDCCGGRDPLCGGGCLVEKALRKRMTA